MAVRQRDLIIIATCLMLLIIVPVIFLTLLFAWRYRESAENAPYNPDWDHSTVLELAIWAAPLLIIITLIMLLVTGLLGYCIFAFNEKRNPKPSKVTHNTPLEIAWTVIPVLILVGIAIPSFRLLYDELTIPKSDLTVKATSARAMRIP